MSFNFCSSNLPDVIESGLNCLGFEKTLQDADSSASSMFEIVRNEKPKNRLSPLEVHRLKQREQYKNMLASLNELIAILPCDSKLRRNQTKQVVLTECKRYIQYLLIVAWCFAFDNGKLEEEILQCLAWDGYCLNEDVLQMLNSYRPLSFKINTKRKSIKRSRSHADNSCYKNQINQHQYSKKRKKHEQDGSDKNNTVENKNKKQPPITRNKSNQTDNMPDIYEPYCRIRPESITHSDSRLKDSLLNTTACMPEPDSLAEFFPEFAWDNNSDDDPSSVQDGFLLIPSESYFNSVNSISQEDADAGRSSMSSASYHNREYQPFFDHNYGRSHPVIVTRQLVTPTSLQPMMIDLDELLFSEDVEVVTDADVYNRQFSTSTFGNSFLDYDDFLDEDFYAPYMSNIPLTEVNAGSSTRSLPAANEAPLDLSMNRSPGNLNQPIDTRSASSDDSSFNQSLEFSPRMFLNILPKSSKETVV